MLVSPVFWYLWNQDVFHDLLAFAASSYPICPTEQSEADIRYILSSPSPAPFIQSPLQVLFPPKPKPGSPCTENSDILHWTSLLQGKVDLFRLWSNINTHQLWKQKYKLFLSELNKKQETHSGLRGSLNEHFQQVENKTSKIRRYCIKIFKKRRYCITQLAIFLIPWWYKKYLTMDSPLDSMKHGKYT